LKDVSALDVANASSNVLASSVAIWFRFGGPNLMVCSGATAGLDAVYLAANLLRAGRADRVVVVGAEPGDPVAVSLHARRARATRAELLPGAAAIVLERAAEVSAGLPVIESIHHGAWPASNGDLADVSIVIGPSMLAARAPRTIDIVRDAGDPYGALGVIQLALASELVRRSSSCARPRVVVACGDEADGWRSTVVRG
jgi:3-oxoacyl-[acyl-carrier-protein] synthase II